MEDFPLPGVDLGSLVAMLVSVPVAEVSDIALVNVVSGMQQAINMLQAAQAGVVREIDARTVDSLAHVPDELACALAITKRAGQDLFLRAWGAGRHPVLADAWAAGGLDARKVDVILAEATHAGPDAEGAVVADAVARSGEMTAPQLQRHVRAAAIALNPDLAEKRRRRRARTPWGGPGAGPGCDGPADRLPACRGRDCRVHRDRRPRRERRVDGDERTIDQRRADAFSDVFTGILDRQATPDGTPLPRKHGQRVALQVTVAATTLAGLDDHPATLGSYGPIPAQVARELAQDATWRRLLTDPTGQVCSVGTDTYRPGADLTRTVIARDVTCTFPGCRQPATRCEIDHRIPYDHTRAPTGNSPGSSAPIGTSPGTRAARAATADTPTARTTSHSGDGHEPQTCEANLHALCKHHHQAKTDGWWHVVHDRTTGISLWTDRHGITYARHPVQIHTTPDSLVHRPPPPDPTALGDPPF